MEVLKEGGSGMADVEEQAFVRLFQVCISSSSSSPRLSSPSSSSTLLASWGRSLMMMKIVKSITYLLSSLQNGISSPMFAQHLEIHLKKALSAKVSRS